MDIFFKFVEYQLILKPAFLFDIDGCLTLPFDERHPVSIIDKKLLEQLYLWQNQGIPLALVTGRSSFYLEEEFLKINFQKGFEFNIYIEFGLLRFYKRSLMKESYPSLFDQEREKFLTDFRNLAEKEAIPMAEGAHVQYPESGMWREHKHVMSSVISNTDVNPSTIHDLASKLLKEKSYRIRLLNHPLGIDILPEGWSKKNAVLNYLQLVKGDYEWFVFGDNRSDEEMTEVLPYSHFTNTRQFGSQDVWRKLRDLSSSFELDLVDIDQSS